MKILLIAIALLLSACSGDGATDLERELRNKQACEQLDGTWYVENKGFFKGMGYCKRGVR